ncbi:MAG: hypothetical protein OEV93_00155 [Candidatus Moranbacteria bacterium]|nr:hypothetical protein [Candidatus Moranbacteria bacterium]
MNKRGWVFYLIAVSVVALVAAYVFTPFGKEKIGKAGYYKDSFKVYYVDRYLIHFDMSRFGMQSALPLVKTIPQAQVDSFEAVGCSGMIARDNEKVFFLDDRSDGNGYVFNALTVVDDVEASEFSMVGEGKCNSFFDDGDKVFLNNSKELIAFDGSDPKSFVVMDAESNRGLDNKHYYCDNKQYPLLENFSLFECSNDYASDGKNVYYIGTEEIGKTAEGCRVKVENADARTFDACGPFGKDSRHLYMHGEIVDAESYLYEGRLDSYNKCFQGGDKVLKCSEWRKNGSTRNGVLESKR